MSRLEKKVAIITGAASGIGRGMARLFSAQGALVIAVDLAEERLYKTTASITEAGGDVVPVVANITNEDDLDRVVAAAVERGGVDILCNNAGVLDDLTPLGDITPELIDRVLGVNVKGTALLSQRVLKVMLAAGSGAIVNTASAAGSNGGRGGAIYTASKHAVIGLTRSVAWYYGPKGIRCNAVAPGAIQTRMQTTMNPHAGGMEAYMPYFQQIPPMGRAGDVAEVAAFLASDEARYVNGAIIPVDGGWLSY